MQLCQSVPVLPEHQRGHWSGGIRHSRWREDQRGHDDRERDAEFRSIKQTSKSGCGPVWSHLDGWRACTSRKPVRLKSLVLKHAPSVPPNLTNIQLAPSHKLLQNMMFVTCAFRCFETDCWT